MFKSNQSTVVEVFDAFLKISIHLVCMMLRETLSNFLKIVIRL